MPSFKLELGLRKVVPCLLAQLLLHLYSAMTSFNSASPITPDQQLLALFEAGRHQEIVAQSQILCVTPQSNPIASNILAAALFQLGDYEQACSILEALEAPLGNESTYLSLYGATCRRLGHLNRAEQLLCKAMTLDPQALAIRNNYANLLIDLDREIEARNILEKILQEKPDHTDARTNLNRIQFRENAKISSQFTHSGLVQNKQLCDPLMMAFGDDEVKQVATKGSNSQNFEVTELASKLPSPVAKDVAADKLKLATRAVNEGKSDFALQLCTQALSGLGANPSIYTNASDAYIRLKRFLDAEICLLHALVIGGPNITHYLNLVSLASIRGDLILADHYLDQAAGIDPSHPQLNSVRSNLLKRKAHLDGVAFGFEATWQDLDSKSQGVVS